MLSFTSFSNAMRASSLISACCGNHTSPFTNTCCIANCDPLCNRATTDPNATVSVNSAHNLGPTVLLLIDPEPRLDFRQHRRLTPLAFEARPRRSVDHPRCAAVEYLGAREREGIGIQDFPYECPLVFSIFLMLLAFFRSLVCSLAGFLLELVLLLLLFSLRQRLVFLRTVRSNGSP